MIYIIIGSYIHFNNFNYILYKFFQLFLIIIKINHLLKIIF